VAVKPLAASSLRLGIPAFGFGVPAWQSAPPRMNRQTELFGV
jgi:hypothetical protein